MSIYFWFGSKGHIHGVSWWKKMENAREKEEKGRENTYPHMQSMYITKGAEIYVK